MQAGNSTDSTKKALRQAVRQRLRDRAPGDDGPVCEAVAAWLRARPWLRTVASYAAMPGEVDLMPLLAAFPACRWVLPRVRGAELTWHAVRDPARDLAPGAFGIREPLAHLSQVEPGEVDLWLCPGLAFDAQGGRLGKGLGYYDRVLAAARPDAVKIGVCHPQQRVENVPVETHDVPMTLVIDGSSG